MRCLGNGLYSLKKCHNTFGQGSPPLAKFFLKRVFPKVSKAREKVAFLKLGSNFDFQLTLPPFSFHILKMKRGIRADLQKKF